jgi:histidinol-phosphate aminotransferase
MAISRRTLLARLSAGVAAAAAPRLAAGAPGAVAAPTETLVGRAPLRLNRNGNAYGPSPEVIAAMQEAAATASFRYPDAEADALRDTIARHHQVAADRVLLGCGSGEVLRAAIDALVGTQKRVIAATPTFELVGQYARRAGAQLVEVPLNRNYSHDLRAMLAQTTAETGLIYLCNPNSPTGGLTRRDDLDAFLRSVPSTAAVLIDEAYHHYAADALDYASFIDRPADNDRVIVTRTFSKIHGLAGLRVGYAIAAPPMARLLAPRLLPGGVGVAAASRSSSTRHSRE